ncbi:hypothetical protein ABNB59_05860 [Paenibacillus larvae]|uniref:hypothetical protein n=1 Tax=Paenibacillus larvae TaxID=1464 RepID=UPI000315DD22|nr:hypothetical protein [Paenibacillus larvae]MCY7476323.1 hypothetical protein [Paenibacillus larvae]MCY7489738.1 hypothetical protein [Paenibacillus larvae]MCY9564415.1 hypothetical protein [Paenibacillus larvae]MCY9569728.1 hypothetical protein [Paenibacillus larvae]MCY9573538.1 hypothetical protein [Paenibacillus larvae]
MLRFELERGTRTEALGGVLRESDSADQHFPSYKEGLLFQQKARDSFRRRSSPAGPRRLRSQRGNRYDQ